MDAIAFSIFTHIAAGVIAISIYRRVVRTPRQNIDIENTTIRCRLTSPDDVDELQNVTRRMGA